MCNSYNIINICTGYQHWKAILAGSRALNCYAGAPQCAWSADRRRLSGIMIKVTLDYIRYVQNVFNM